VKPFADAIREQLARAKRCPRCVGKGSVMSAAWVEWYRSCRPWGAPEGDRWVLCPVCGGGGTQAVEWEADAVALARRVTE